MSDGSAALLDTVVSAIKIKITFITIYQWYSKRKPVHAIIKNISFDITIIIVYSQRLIRFGVFSFFNVFLYAGYG